MTPHDATRRRIWRRYPGRPLVALCVFALLACFAGCAPKYVHIERVNNFPWWHPDARTKTTLLDEPKPWTWDELGLAGLAASAVLCDVVTTNLGPPPGYRETNGFARDHLAVWTAATLGVHTALLAFKHWIGFRRSVSIAEAGGRLYACGKNVEILSR